MFMYDFIIIPISLALLYLGGEGALKGVLAFADYYAISLDLLLKEDLQSYSESKLSQLDRRELDVTGSNLRVLATTVGNDNEENIELVPKKAKAGYTEGHRDPDFINVLSTFRMPFLDRNKKYRTFQISGDSMPPVADGSWVTGDFVQNWEHIRDGYPYIIVTKDDGIVFKITKNRITKLALEKTKCKDLSNLFTGPTAVAFGEDAIMSARILSKFAKDNENLKLIGGIMENEVLDQAGVMNVANLPTLDEARANIVGILSASASKLVSILLARSEKMSNLPVENSENQPKD